MKNVYMQIIKEDGKSLKPVIRNTEKGRGKYANKAFNKYGDNVTVEEYEFDNECNVIIRCKWHA